MKKLSELIQEAEERFLEKYTYEVVTWTGGKIKCFLEEVNHRGLNDFLKTELEQIVKESFKNTRVEEEEQKPCHEINLTQTKYWCASCKNDTGKCEVVELNDKRNEALSDKHNKECEFLGN